MECISCKNKSEIEIKKITFCNHCFSRKLIKKVRQIINTMKNKTILVIVDGSSLISTALHILNEIFQYRHEYTVSIYFKDQTNKDVIIQESKMAKFKVVNNEKKEFENLLSQNLIDIIHLETIDDLAYKSFSYILNGEGMKAVNNLTSNIYRPFEKISNYEMMCYYNINKCKIIELINEKSTSKIEQITKDFLERLNKNNYSTSYNIVETLKKINKN